MAEPVFIKCEPEWPSNTEESSSNIEPDAAVNFVEVKHEPDDPSDEKVSDLSRDRNYFNSQGSGPLSSPVTVYVGEVVLTGEPRDVVGEPVSSTEVRLRWKPPQQNGELLGYKIFYLVTDSPQETGEIEEELEVVPASYTSHGLVSLDKYTEYRIQIVAFNPAGDGPRSTPITLRTLPDLPGPPLNLRFMDITMSSLKMMWDPPKERNGIIIDYLVTYETAEENKRFSKQMKQKVSGTSLLISSLEEEVTYVFSVRAQTKDYGPAVTGNVTTGPQEGSPAAPKDLVVSKTVSSIELHWINGPSGKGAILGYYIQTRRKDDNQWQTITQTSNGPLQEFTISYQNMLPSTAYTLRLITYNKYGISHPTYSEDVEPDAAVNFVEVKREPDDPCDEKDAEEDSLGEESDLRESHLNENQTSVLLKTAEVPANQHRTRKGYPCGVCGKVYSQKGNMVRHLMSHTEQRPYSCNACYKTFTRPSHLRSHSVIHTGERPFSCTICGNNFAQRNSLKRHMRAHTGERPYSCSCGKTFAKRDVLKTHMLVHIQSKPHVCETCGKTFAHRGNLKTHQLLHTGEKPHSCPTCGKAFTQLSHVKSHVLVHRHYGQPSNIKKEPIDSEIGTV